MKNSTNIKLLNNQTCDVTYLLSVIIKCPNIKLTNNRMKNTKARNKTLFKSKMILSILKKILEWEIIILLKIFFKSKIKIKQKKNSTNHVIKKTFSSKKNKKLLPQHKTLTVFI